MGGKTGETGFSGVCDRCDSNAAVRDEQTADVFASVTWQMMARGQDWIPRVIGEAISARMPVTVTMGKDGIRVEVGTPQSFA